LSASAELVVVISANEIMFLLCLFATRLIFTEFDVRWQMGQERAHYIVVLMQVKLL